MPTWDRGNKHDLPMSTTGIAPVLTADPRMKGRSAMEVFGHHIDRHFPRRHLMLSACAAAIVLVVIGIVTGVGPLSILGGAFCAVMMAMMVWMMVGMMRGHGH